MEQVQNPLPMGEFQVRVRMSKEGIRATELYPLAGVTLALTNPIITIWGILKTKAAGDIE